MQKEREEGSKTSASGNARTRNTVTQAERIQVSIFAPAMKPDVSKFMRINLP